MDYRTTDYFVITCIPLSPCPALHTRSNVISVKKIGRTMSTRLNRLEVKVRSTWLNMFRIWNYLEV